MKEENAAPPLSCHIPQSHPPVTARTSHGSARPPHLSATPCPDRTSPSPLVVLPLAVVHVAVGPFIDPCPLPPPALSLSRSALLHRPLVPTLPAESPALRVLSGTDRGGGGKREGERKSVIGWGWGETQTQ